MTPKILLYTFPYPGPFGEAFSREHTDLAHALAETPGLVWKIWLENAASQTAGGVYVFKDEASLAAFRAEHNARLAAFGIHDFGVQAFDANVPLSKITRAPLA